MTDVFIVHGNDYDDQEVRGVYATYRDALTHFNVPVACSSSLVSITQWRLGVGAVVRPTLHGFHVYATRVNVTTPWNFRVQVGSAEFDAEDDPIAHRVTPRSVHVWALDKQEAGRLAYALMKAENDAVEEAAAARKREAVARREAENARKRH
ncbi:hypothetical protein ACQR3W_21785 [Rhodococcus ruber]|uniref:Uncharacterized protein n=1 Tax=Rhodococcus ruber TaxID=1830 RepID=A0A098BL74_9NOCA|nr:hypothetical protein [Rhodococcus ruber]MCZ4533352.1 hypothetical protein [Rhodococcus ruber]MCZ4533397.1 hypothetical protein [Rhodococcus ruber]CDZ88990.1 hypothetical protein RHRU231_450157 [Rhodococcus ruber]